MGVHERTITHRGSQSRRSEGRSARHQQRTGRQTDPGKDGGLTRKDQGRPSGSRGDPVRHLRGDRLQNKTFFQTRPTKIWWSTKTKPVRPDLRVTTTSWTTKHQTPWSGPPFSETLLHHPRTPHGTLTTRPSLYLLPDTRRTSLSSLEDQGRGRTEETLEPEGTSPGTERRDGHGTHS